MVQSRTRTAPSNGRTPVVDIGVYVLASFTILGIERVAEAGGLLPGADLFGGAPTLVVSLLVVVSLQRRRGSSLRDLGLHRPERWWHVLTWGLAVLVFTIVVQLTVVPALGAALGTPEADFSRYDALVGNFPLYLVTVAGAMFTGGFIEEVIFRGFLMDRLDRILGGGRGSASGAALLSGVAFGLVHFEWGFGGIVMTAAIGAGLGFMFLATKRSLWPLIAAHATLDLLLLSTLYLGFAE